jgi:predicted dehydrogenase
LATEQKRALVVGTVFGARVQVPALRAAGFDVVGLVGTDAARTASRAAASGVSGAFTDLDEAIRQTGPTVVAIATPPQTHRAQVDTALAHGCHILCEKPFAKDAAEGRLMLDAVRLAGVTHMVGHEFRWTPEQALAARALAEGVIGEPLFATLVLYLPFVGARGADMPPWWFDKAAGGGWLGASGSHSIDQIRLWLGEFATVSAALPTVSVPKGGAEDSFAIRFTLANGVEGVLQQTGGAWGPPSDTTRVAGSAGTLWLANGGVFVADKDGVRQLPMPRELVLPPPRPDDPPPHMIGLYTRLCEHLRSVLDGEPPPAGMPTPTFADGVACMAVLDAIRASAASGGALVEVGSNSA